jgi:hypothetical protein
MPAPHLFKVSDDVANLPLVAWHRQAIANSGPGVRRGPRYWTGGEVATQPVFQKGGIRHEISLRGIPTPPEFPAIPPLGDDIVVGSQLH